MTSRSPDVLIGTAMVGIGYLLGSLGPCVVLLARDLDVARGELTWLSSGFGAALLVAGAAGPLYLRLGLARALRASAALLATGLVLLALAHSLFIAQAGAFLAGAGGAALVLICPAALAGPRVIARLTRVNAAASVASVGAPLFIAALDELAGHGRLALLVPLPGLLWVVLRSDALHAAPPAPSADSTANTRTGARVAAAWSAIVLAVSAEFAFLVWGAARLQDGGLDAAAASGWAAAFPIGMAAGRVIAPRLFGNLPLFAIGVSLGTAGALGVAASSGVAVATGALFLAGLGIAVLYPMTLGALVATPGLGRSAAAALGCAASGTAVVAGPILLDALADRTGLRTAFLAIVPLFLVLVALRALHRAAAASAVAPRAAT